MDVNLLFASGFCLAEAYARKADMERHEPEAEKPFSSRSVVDLSHVVDNGTKPYPGDPAPRLDTAADITHDSCCVTRISLATHTGTHVDAEAHVIHGGKCLGDYPLTAFSGLARVADLRGLSMVDVSALDSIESCDWLLLCTGQSEKWGSEEYFGTEPLFTEAFVKAAARIARKGIGLDCSGLDREGVALHQLWFSSGGGLMVENLTDLEMLLSESRILFAAYPLKLAAVDGAPVRAVAMLV